MEALLYINNNLEKLFNECEYPTFNNPNLTFVQPNLDNHDSIIVLNQILTIVLTDKLYPSTLSNLNLTTLQNLINLNCNEICNKKYKLTYTTINQNSIEIFKTDFFNYLNSLFS